MHPQLGCGLLAEPGREGVPASRAQEESSHVLYISPKSPEITGAHFGNLGSYFSLRLSFPHTHSAAHRTGAAVFSTAPPDPILFLFTALSICGEPCLEGSCPALLPYGKATLSVRLRGTPSPLTPPAAANPGLCVYPPLFMALRSQQNIQIWLRTGTVFICNSQPSPSLTMPLHLIFCKFASLFFRQNHIARGSRRPLVAQTAMEILFK